jgi:hypothetical protein
LRKCELKTRKPPFTETTDGTWALALALLAVGLGGLLLAACGGGDGEKATSSSAAKSRSPTAVAVKYDFGDAPEPKYPTALVRDGARHLDVTRAWLGSSVDREKEANRQEDSLDYTGDKFDDGLVAAAPLEFAVTNSDWDGPLYVNALVDYNGDGDWTDEDEWRIQNLEANVPMGETMEFATDFVFDELMWLRITITGEPLESYDGTGEFAIGETEDHMWQPLPTRCC